MTLFVGGPRHGGSIEDESAVFTDIASGERYLRKPVSFTNANPITKRPEWTYTVNVFVHEAIASERYACHTCQSLVDAAHGARYSGHRIEVLHPAQQVFAATQDAVMRAWFVANGERSRATGVAAPPVEAVPGNGAGTPAEPAIRYHASCDECTALDGSTPLVRTFDSPAERGRWASEHIEQTQHRLTFAEVPA